MISPFNLVTAAVTLGQLTRSADNATGNAAVDAVVALQDCARRTARSRLAVVAAAVRLTSITRRCTTPTTPSASSRRRWSSKAGIACGRRRRR
jgi:hypothetical protein